MKGIGSEFIYILTHTRRLTATPHKLITAGHGNTGATHTPRQAVALVTKMSGDRSLSEFGARI